MTDRQSRHPQDTHKSLKITTPVVTPVSDIANITLTTPNRAKRHRVVCSDVEPSSDSEQEETTTSTGVTYHTA